LCCLPIHLVAGLAVVGRAWTTGAALVVHPGFDPLAVADAGRRADGSPGDRPATEAGAAGLGRTFVSLVPTMLRRLLDSDPDAVDADGWYRTGDLGRFDPEAGGRRWVVDRLGYVVNSGGIKVSPTEVERVLARHPAVADVCVAGRPDPEWGQRVVAFVVPAEPAAPPALDELRTFARAELPAPKLPREVVLVAVIPRTPGGKPLRRLLPGGP